MSEPAVPRGLRYVSDREPGFSRRRVGTRGFIYFDSHRDRVRDDGMIDRFRALVIPPAWKDVWICRFANGHLQVTGRDARDRKQYRYHSKWTEVRNESKFEKLALFGETLPKIYQATEADLKLSGLPKDKVLAAVVRVMDLTRVRVGNDIYAEQNDSYGLTTMRNDHAQVKGHKVRFRFRGKSGVERDVAFEDPRLSRIIKNCQDLPGEELFCYEDDDGEVHDVSSTDVNEYLKRITGEDLTAKDFRTWGGTVKALEIIKGLPALEKESEAAWKKRRLEVIREVSRYLGNTVAVCRKYYIHPGVFEADESGYLARKNKKARGAAPSQDLVLDVLKRFKIR